VPTKEAVVEGERWAVLYRVIVDEGSRRPPARRHVHADAAILLVLVWAALHDRPMSWACEAAAWAGCPAGDRPAALPSPATVSRRTRTVGVLGLLDQALARPAALRPPALVRRVDGKPLPVGGRSNDRDARWGRAADHKARGYKQFIAWGGGVVPDAWAVGPMNEPEVEAAKRLVPRLAGGGYLLGDALYDSNPLHAVADANGFQLVAPRKDPGAGLGHCRHEPGRLRSIALLETPAAGDPPAAGRSAFARDLYARRTEVERELGGWCSFGGGLAPLPAWVRTPHRVAYWTAAKLLINGVRLCGLRGLAA
jgi:hypothetical protein